MRRLRDQDHRDPAVARAARLLAAIPPITPSANRMRRARLGIDVTPSPRRSARWLVLAAAALFVLGGGAVAGATWGRSWLAQRRLNSSKTNELRSTPSRAPRPISAPPPNAVRPEMRTPARVEPSPVGAAGDHSSARPPTTERLDHISPPLHAGAARDNSARENVARDNSMTAAPRSLNTDSSANKPNMANTVNAAHIANAASPPLGNPSDTAGSSAMPLPVDVPEAEGAALLADALHSMRQDHDPVAACARVDEYLRLHASGVLVEEALALGMEADRSGVCGRRDRYAADYLRRFPEGRFARMAGAGIGNTP